MKSPLIPLLKSGQTVFSNDDLRLYWGVDGADYLKTKIYRLVREKLLLPLASGVYSTVPDYDPLELANKLVTPSYVSLRTVLAQAGAVFQYDSAIHSVAQVTREQTVGSRTYSYRKVKDAAFLASDGILFGKNVTIATPERALLDLLYLEKDASIDNLAVFDQARCRALLPLYANAQLTRRLNALFNAQ
jgi:hypothetical protein